MAGMDFTSIPVSWKDCTGYSSRFPSEAIETYVPIPFSGFTTQAWAPFVSPRLKDVDRSQKLSHYRGQIEPPASLPRGATVRCFGELMLAG